ncbi:MAG: tetratricopeptide repeat protein [Saprospiraceae bacterium]|nr:tetratricopeptide repeat protein [Saprospiraceae bacterium]
MRKPLIVWSFCLGGILNMQVWAQQPVDSMLAAFNAQSNDSLKWIALFHISQHYAKENLDSALVWAQKGLEYAEKHAPYLTPRSLNNIGLQYMNKGNLDLALEYYLKSVDAANKYQCRPCLATTTGNMGIIAWNKKEYEKATAYFKEAIQLMRSLKDAVGEARYLNNLGLVQTDLGDLNNAEKSFNTALSILEEADTISFQPTIYNNLANIAYARREFGKALEFYEKTGHYAELTNDGSAMFLAVNNAGWVYLALKNYENAVKQFEKAALIAQNLKNDKYREQAIGALADTYKAKGDFQLGFFYLEAYLKLHDSLATTQNSKVVMELETQYQTQQKEAAIKNLEAENRIRNLVNYGAIAGVLGLLVVLWLSRRTFRQRRLIQQTTIERLESERKVVALNAHVEGQNRERLRIAEDLHDDFGSGLSKISLLSEVVKKKFQTPELDKISASAKELLLKMSEIVWALNHRNDTLPSLASYIRRYSSGFFEDSNTQCVFNFSDPLPEITLSGEARRNIFLVIKETLHNTLKHAYASILEISLQYSEGALSIEIKDNGTGFDTSEISRSGNGLLNMAKRMQSEGGLYHIESEPGKGTVTRLAMQLQVANAAEAVAA